VALARSTAAGAPDPLLCTGNVGTDPVPEPKVVVDTCQPLEQCVAITLDAVSGRLKSGTDFASGESLHPI
jgi:hypothetical protein